MQRDLGITFVHVTHSQLEAIALADLVVVMDKGKIRQAGAARDVYAAPKTGTSLNSWRPERAFRPYRTVNGHMPVAAPPAQASRSR